MKTQVVEINYLDDGVASLRIATDENPYLGAQFVPELSDVIEQLRTNETIRAIIVEGGLRYFSAGASRAALLSTDPQSTFPNYVAELPRLLISLPVPTIAAMAGHAIGGGLILGLWCDIVVLAEESLYGANFMALGLTPGMGSTVILEETVGAPLARELLFTGRLIKGRELKAASGLLAHAVVPKVEVCSRAMELAQEIADLPRETLVLLKQSLSSRRKALLERAINKEQEMHTIILAREETWLQIKERYIMPNIAVREEEA